MLFKDVLTNCKSYAEVVLGLDVHPLKHLKDPLAIFRFDSNAVVVN